VRLLGYALSRDQETDLFRRPAGEPASPCVGEAMPRCRDALATLSQEHPASDAWACLLGNPIIGESCPIVGMSEGLLVTVRSVICHPIERFLVCLA